MYLNLKELGLKDRIVLNKKQYTIKCFSINTYRDLIEFIKVKIPDLYSLLDEYQDNYRENKSFGFKESFFWVLASYGDYFNSLIDNYIKYDIKENELYKNISPMIKLYYFEFINSNDEIVKKIMVSNKLNKLSPKLRVVSSFNEIIKQIKEGYN